MQDNRRITTFVKCGHCQSRFPAGIQLGTVANFENTKTWGNIEVCQNCGKPVNCNQNNMSYLIKDGEKDGRSPGGGMGPDYTDNKA